MGRPAVAAALLAALATLAAPGTAFAAAEPEGEPVCTVDDPRAVELSGLVATADGFVSIVDSQNDPDQVVIVYLDAGCRVVRTQAYPAPPRDPEDLAVAPDGALWAADIGDNITSSNRRQTVALWRIPPGGGTPVIYRLTYPDGPHDAEALLFAADGTPIVVTKELGAATYLYQATRPLEPDTTTGVPMQRVGEFHPVARGDPNDLGRIGELLVTGAATAPDRGRVVLRTYAAAYEWDVPDGDVVRAITTGTPRYTPLPGEPQGEAICYTVDGQQFLTVSDEAGPATIRRYARGTASPQGSTSALATVTALGSPEPIVWYGAGLAVAGAVALLGTAAVLLRRRTR